MWKVIVVCLLCVVGLVAAANVAFGNGVWGPGMRQIGGTQYGEIYKFTDGSVTCYVVERPAAAVSISCVRY